jgi:hypothetical protein
VILVYDCSETGETFVVMTKQKSVGIIVVMIIIGLRLVGLDDNDCAKIGQTLRSDKYCIVAGKRVDFFTCKKW